MAPKLNKQNYSNIFFSLPILFHPFPSSSFTFSAKFNHVCEASIYILSELLLFCLIINWFLANCLPTYGSGVGRLTKEKDRLLIEEKKGTR
ncbi:hypothetical protein RDI58_021476 [Solanum bulbocastanum]|uniref:Transmembrane protein n=1 Tax=Solanum bulbocastanum TaxID=147425 RepID=A0AAN8Y4Y7_SOLBU